MPGMMQWKGKLPGRTLRVSFKSAFFSVKPPLPTPPTPSLDLLQYLALTLRKGERSDERMGDLKTSVSLRGGARHKLQLCTNYSLIHKYSYIGIEEDLVSCGPLKTCCVGPFHILFIFLVRQTWSEWHLDLTFLPLLFNQSSTCLFERKLTLIFTAHIYSSGTLLLMWQWGKEWADVTGFKLVSRI